MLINKDCYYAIKEDLIDYKGQIDLIYIDPPFATGKSFKNKNNELCYDDKNFSTKEYSGEIEGLLTFIKIKDFEKNYLRFMYTRILLMKELLSEKGSIYVHCDWHIGHYLKIILDEIFGKENFINEIVWRYGKMSNESNSFAKNHDNIFLYSKNINNQIFNKIYFMESEYKVRYSNYIKENKIYYSDIKHSKDNIVRARINSIKNVKEDTIIFDFDEEFKAQDSVFYDISIIKGNSNQNIDYPTQKPEKLLERVIKASSNDGSIVLDCFCGSGTTLAVAEKLKRKWIGCDINKNAIDICEKRINKLKH